MPQSSGVRPAPPDAVADQQRYRGPTYDATRRPVRRQVRSTKPVHKGALTFRIIPWLHAVLPPHSQASRISNTPGRQTWSLG